MSALFNLIPLPYRILALIALAAALMGFGWVKGAEHGEAKLNEYQLQVQANTDRANQDNIAKTLALQAQVTKAQNDAIKRAHDLQVVVSQSRAQSDSLRNDLDRLKGNLPQLADDAIRKYAATLADVLGECVTQYQSVAASADGHAIDAQTLSDAWPR